jgi:hypothetical protein
MHTANREKWLNIRKRQEWLNALRPKEGVGRSSRSEGELFRE